MGRHGTREAILETLSRGESLTSEQIALRIGRYRGVVQTNLSKLYREGLIRKTSVGKGARAHTWSLVPDEETPS